MNSAFVLTYNEAIAWATAFGAARTRSTRLECELLAELKATLSLPELTWHTTLMAFGSIRRRWAPLTWTSLTQPERVAKTLSSLWESADIADMRSAIEAFNASTHDIAGTACSKCDSGVGAGVKCSKCGHCWHWGCAWRTLDDQDAVQILPPRARFATAGLHNFNCLLCREGLPADPTRGGSLLERFRRRIQHMSMDDAWDLIQLSLDAGPARRRLPGSGLQRGTVCAGRHLAAAAVTALASLAEHESDAAELLLLFAPRVFMRKGTPIEVQINAIVEGRSPTVADLPQPEHGPLLLRVRWKPDL